MDIFNISALLTALLVIFLGGSVWIGVSLFFVGAVSLDIFTGMPIGTLAANIAWNSTNGSTLTAIPLFVLMGEILFCSKISENLFNGLAPWMENIPGRLIHVNVFASSLFAAISGSASATTATVGKMTLPELRKRGYNRSLCIGSLAGAGTLGFLIPPSMMMLVYGMLADVSIGKLFIAGFIPGILIALVFSGYIALRCVMNPQLAPASKSKYTWEDKLHSIPNLFPIMLLIFVVFGSIYAGFATPTEAAAVGVLGAVIFAILGGGFTWAIFEKALMNSVKTSSMVLFIMVGASYLSVSVGFLGLASSLSKVIATMNLSPYFLIFMLALVYIFLGCFIDSFSMLVMCLPITLPLIKLAGYDPIWYGIFLVVMIQIAQITPPLGFSLFVIHGLDGDSISYITKASIPFFLLFCLIAAVLTVFPEIVMFLPNMMIQ